MRHKHKRSAKAYARVPNPSKGKINHRIIAKVVDDTHEYTLHATKGYRAKANG